MDKNADLSLIVARRQKRLNYWVERFQSETAASATGASAAGAAPKPRFQKGSREAEIHEKLSTFALLLSKLVKAENPTQLQESESRLQALERELTGLFEARRLMTSSIGVPAVGE